MSLVQVNGPQDLPELRNWMADRFKPGGSLAPLPDSAFVDRSLRTAQLWWVDEETCHLLAESAPTWPDDAVLDIHTVPTLSGMAIFAHDIIGHDTVHDEEIRISGLVWGPVTLPPLGTPDGLFYEKDGRVGIGIGALSRIDLHDGLDQTDLRNGLLFNMLMSDIFAKDAKPGDAALFTPEGRHGTVYAYLGRTDWLPGHAAGTPIPDAPRGNDPVAIASMIEDRKMMAALWALTKTSIVSTTVMHPPRPVMRRSERRGLDPKVRVLRLGGARTAHAGVPTETHRDWKHSWLVRPHWRWQAHGKDHAERKLILVGPYVKGDTTKPLIGAERVWRVVPPAGGMRP